MNRHVGLSGAAVDTGAAGVKLPLFLLSFHSRNELGALIERTGRQVIAGRRIEGAERRFISSGATIAVIDARGATAEAEGACAALTGATQSAGSALLVIAEQVADLDRWFDLGATHYLVPPFGEAELRAVLAFADRHVERVAGGGRAASQRAALRLAESEAWIWKPGERLVSLSPAFAERIGAMREIVPMSMLFRLIDRPSRRLAREAIDRLLVTGRSTAFAHGGRGHGDRLAHHISYDRDRGAVVAWIEINRAEAEPEREREDIDALTGLPTADRIRRWVEARLADDAAPDPRCALLMLGIMRFGLVNAAFGRPTGDAVLQGVARRIERVIDRIGIGNAMVARTAGSEFAIALGPPVSADSAELIANRLVESVAWPFVSGDSLIPLSCRVGIAAIDGEGRRDAGTLFQRAAAALAAAKHGDSGLVRALDADSEAEAHRRNQLEIDLRRALDHDQIDILFQPQVDVGTGRIMGVEALARWRHPQLGELGAVPLFATAARSDFVVQLSTYVQQRALAIASAWPPSMHDLRLAMNVTASDIAQPGFVEELLSRVDAAGFPRTRLTVEVTESGLISDLAGAADLLAQLRRAGLRVAIDDFGTGYSSLAYLKALPLDYLKIDKTLAEDITGSTRDRIVVRGVIDMARSLGLSVITEGVETQAQLSLLAREGCNYYQGFLCSPPIDSSALQALLAEQAEAVG
ncbi:bifunctional diguanylate cyclase/phosphodiesterase [Sphingomonadaceae bacterium G21617-S1]|uniref:putative bifunctional diguanylate cyclase/phosphodiesterase n=1 Tax=Rhizorhabdus sp. TaxID=1968843 RepID=UPI0022C1D63E|nr:bifunctional diguanylate cyclase/phosphodiesterase [Rhizorhabdus sp.]MCZ4342401.1 bifunctional diguanylate cyclase/phosphodiesterase [Sphingomonadaceae bacterium G21617-S1]